MINCWEFKKCGRQFGGAKANELGVCPANSDATYNGVNNGKNGGRYCWRIAGTLCGGKRQGTYAMKAKSCTDCDFFKSVVREEQGNLKI